MKVEADGYIKVQGKKGQGGGTSIVYASGTTGGATMTLGYFDDYNSFIALTDGVVLIDTQTQVDHGSDTPVYLSVTGATGTTALSVFVNGKA